MARHFALPLALFFATLLWTGPRFSVGTNFTVLNHCKETVWTGITPSENITITDFTLQPGKSSFFTAPTGWHGRVWGRTGCSFDNTGNGTCQTGSCGSSLKCSEPGQQPATIAEFTLGQTDFYDVSLVGGFNLPMTVSPRDGKGNCSTAGCDGDLRDNCPQELAVKDDGKTTACRSPCDKFNTDQYCCRGTYGSPMSCQATNYSTSFKKVCPAAYSYAFDDPTSVVTCSSVSGYIVTFCATRNQTVCKYNDQQVVCNKAGVSSNMKAIQQIWWIIILSIFSVFS
ncbi:hypothetical protein RND81_14G008400 [Saponaria officinalis]|uniref:Thaumatin-like protein n=1 Tax=Saponaria officinalis TaxID=3572 RepID=A0AAW1GJP0_SAPOF